jgi:AbrB family looped-hinge helix DNA binding protein
MGPTSNGARKCNKTEEFYGTTTVGEKGQIVIPAEAREKMNLQKGDKLLVFGMGCDMIAFSKLSNLEKFASHLSKQADAIREVINKSNKK